MNKEQSNAQKKLIIQFRKMMDTEAFQSEVLICREKIGIPKTGWYMPEEDLLRLGGIMYLPSQVKKLDERSRTVFQKTLRETIDKIMKPFPIRTTYFDHLLACYIFHNKPFFEEILEQSNYLEQSSLCALSDTKNELYEIIPEDLHVEDFLPHRYIDAQRSLVNKFPVAIRIHPEASQRDIVDFIKKNWAVIDDLQNQHKQEDKPTIKHARTKINEETAKRNELIYNNRNLSGKEICKILVENGFEVMDYGSILKIKSLEKQRREKK